MNWIRELNRAIDYIEAHITEPTDYERIAQEMNISSFYFQKIFSILCGYTVGEYIRNRRLTLAGNELLTTDAKIIDIAMKYGYDTPEGFTRAFTRFHGVTPSAARREGARLKVFAKLSITILLKGGDSMNYKIEQKGAFRVIAKKQRFEAVEDVVGRKDIPAFWKKCHEDGTVQKLLEIGKKGGVLGGSLVGMCMEDSTVVKDFPYLIGAEYGGGQAPDGFEVCDIPAAEWAIFDTPESEAPEEIQKLWHQIFAEFFPASEYRPAGNFDLEVYTDQTHSQIWIAVTKK